MKKLLAFAALSFAAYFAWAQTVIITSSPVTYSTGGTPIPPTPQPPSYAAALGYNTLTFSSTSFTAANIDTTHAHCASCSTPGSSTPTNYWYKCDFQSTPLTTDVTFPGDGSAKLSGYQNAELCSASKNSAGTNFVGTAFGGGAYYEITASFPVGDIQDSTGWPSLWTETLEGTFIDAASTCNEGSNFPTNAPCAVWPNTAAFFTHQIENDWMEDNGTNGGKGRLASALHESFGVYNSTCPYVSGTWNHSFCQNDSNIPIYNIGTAVVSQQHKYGMLWKPATSTSNGSVTYYFDRSAQGGTPAVQWAQFLNTGTGVYVPGNLTNYCGNVTYSNSCGTPSWGFGIHDVLHHVIIMGTGQQSSSPMYIYSVNVWQANASQNIVN